MGKKKRKANLQKRRERLQRINREKVGGQNGEKRPSRKKREDWNMKI